MLDIGCSSVERDGTWLHGLIWPEARYIIGIDIKGVKELKARGFNVKHINAERPFDLGIRVDVVLAAEVLDHVCDLGIVIDNIARHLKSNGIAVITLHNPQAFEFFLELLVRGKSMCDVHTHTHWQSERTLSCLLEKHGMELVSREYIHFKAGSRLGRVYDVLFFWLPQRFSRSVLYIARRKDAVVS